MINILLTGFKLFFQSLAVMNSTAINILICISSSSLDNAKLFSKMILSIYTSISSALRVSNLLCFIFNHLVFKQDREESQITTRRNGEVIYFNFFILEKGSRA